jgi:hypothetical protein
LKAVQKSLDVYENGDLEGDAEDGEEYGEPNPKELPKEEEVKVDEEGGEEEK